MKIVLPNDWAARPYQSPFWRALIQGKTRRAAVVWPRRAGKDRTSMAMTSVMAVRRPGVYWHMLPTNVQARKVVWDAVDRKTGKPVLDVVFPPSMVASKNDAEMGIDLRTGSKWYAVGSDNYNRLVGSDPLGVVFSEYSLGDPSAWNYIRPILAENGGWAVFLFTPRGRNHGFSLYNMASTNSDWFCELLTTDQTKHISQEDIDAERKAGMPEEMIQQEFYCSFAAGALGAYYGQAMEKARAEKRVGDVPWDSGYSTEMWLDLGYNDVAAVWIVQPRGMNLCAVRYDEFKTMSIPKICDIVKGWNYKIDLIRLPHDGEVHDQTTGMTRSAQYEERLNAPGDGTPRPRGRDELLQQIGCTRRLIDTMHFDKTLCEKGIYALESYCREWDSKLLRFNDTPKHDWASHGADALRTGAVKHVPGLYGGTSAQRQAARGRKPRMITSSNSRERQKTPIEEIMRSMGTI